MGLRTETSIMGECSLEWGSPISLLLFSHLCEEACSDFGRLVWVLYGDTLISLWSCSLAFPENWKTSYKSSWSCGPLYFFDGEEQDQSGGFYHRLQGKWDQLSVYWDFTGRPYNINTGEARARSKPFGSLLGLHYSSGPRSGAEIWS